MVSLLLSLVVLLLCREARPLYLAIVVIAEQIMNKGCSYNGSAGSTLTVLILGVCCKIENKFSNTFLNGLLNFRLNYNLLLGLVVGI